MAPWPPCRAATTAMVSPEIATERPSSSPDAPSLADSRACCAKRSGPGAACPPAGRDKLATSAPASAVMTIRRFTASPSFGGPRTPRAAVPRLGGDVLVEPEGVRGVVATLERDQPLVL